jgi:hypothetical protein
MQEFALIALFAKTTKPMFAHNLFVLDDVPEWT